jgi:hypothetical protein
MPSSPFPYLLIVLDCCFTGTFRWFSARKAIPEAIHRQYYDRLIDYPAWQVITSAAHNQAALDFLSDKQRVKEKDVKHSLFSLQKPCSRHCRMANLLTKATATKKRI